MGGLLLAITCWPAPIVLLVLFIMQYLLCGTTSGPFSTAFWHPHLAAASVASPANAGADEAAERRQ